LLLLFVFLYACIGEDLVDDSVPPEVRITNPIISLEAGTTHQYQAKYFDFVGREVSSKPFGWESSDPAVASVNSQGLVTALTEGSAVITATSEDEEGNEVSTSDEIEVSQNTVAENMVITGMLQTTSTYLLQGSFRLEKTEDALTLYLEDNYRADTRLPRLVVFLSNNRNSIADAYEIAEVSVFSGAHSYDLPSEFGLMDYRYILYWCEPFMVDVGEGVLIP
jgi:hypothetical protein